MIFGIGKKKGEKKTIQAPTRSKGRKSLFAPLRQFFFKIISKYSASQEEVVGIEVTPTAVKVAQLKELNDIWSLTKFSYRNVENGNEELLRSNPEIYVEQIQTALQIAKIETTNAAIALPVSSAIIRVLQMPVMSDEEMENAIATDSLWENLTQLPDALENYSIFHQVIKRHTENNIMDVLFVASKIDDVNLYADIVRQAGLSPVIVDVRCFALRNAFETQVLNQPKIAQQKGPLAILEFSDNENFILILQEETPYVVDIFIRPQDKELLATMSGAMGSGYIDQLLIDVLNRFTVQIKQALAGFENQYKTQPIKDLTVVSPLPAISGVVQELQKGFDDMNMTIHSPFANLTIPEQLKEKTTTEENPSMFTAVIGLATRRLDVFGYFKLVTGVRNINLLPNRSNIKKKKRADMYSKFIYIGASVFTSLLLVLYGFLAFNKYSSNKQELADYESINQQFNQQNEEFQKFTLTKEGLEKDLSKGQFLKSNSKSSLLMFTEITQAVPNDAVLVKIRTSEDDYNQLVVEGQSMDDRPIIDLIDALNSRDTIEKASLVNMAVTEPEDGKNTKEVKSFEISVIAKDLSSEENEENEKESEIESIINDAFEN